MSLDRRAELRSFLTSRRAAITAADRGLPETGRRRVAGLRREEVAALSGVGVTWYTLFERGIAERVSDDVIERISGALQLSDAERMYLRDIAGNAPRKVISTHVEPWVQTMLTSLSIPAYVITPTWDVLAYNRIFAEAFNHPVVFRPFNKLVDIFERSELPAAHGSSWPSFVDRIVGMFRSAYGAFGAIEPRFDAIITSLESYADFRVAWQRLLVVDPGEAITVNVEIASRTAQMYRADNFALLASPGQWLVVHTQVEPLGD